LACARLSRRQGLAPQSEGVLINSPSRRSGSALARSAAGLEGVLPRCPGWPAGILTWLGAWPAQPDGGTCKPAAWGNRSSFEPVETWLARSAEFMQAVVIRLPQGSPLIMPPPLSSLYRAVVQLHRSLQANRRWRAKAVEVRQHQRRSAVDAGGAGSASPPSQCEALKRDARRSSTPGPRRAPHGSPLIRRASRRRRQFQARREVG